jgi:hypothetical protein
MPSWKLIFRAACQRKLTYGALARKLGFKGAWTLSHLLGHIMHYS